MLTLHFMIPLFLLILFSLKAFMKLLMITSKDLKILKALNNTKQLLIHMITIFLIKNGLFGLDLLRIDIIMKSNILIQL